MIGTISLSGFGLATAFAAGFISFLSPCVWPLVPVYLSYVSGVPYDELGANTRRVVTTTLAFVGGFTIIFALYGVSVGYLGSLVADYRRPIEIVGGIVVVLMGLALLGFAQRLVGREARVGLPARPTSLAGAGLAGVVFAVGWTPCIGPVLTSILLYAATQGSAGGSLLLFAYGIGLGVPFLLSGLLASWLLERTGAYRKYGAWINRAAGVVMIIVGILLATGELTRITQQLSGYGVIV
jgi:cytochrome c-type biogenesis protein